MRAARKLWAPCYRSFAVRGPVDVGERFHLGPGSRVEAFRGLSIGNDVYVGKYCSIVADGEIGDDVLIANNVGIIGRHDHDHEAIGVGIRRAPWIGDPGSELGRDEPVIVESDVWIGFGAVVLTGVRIGRGAIVAAGSVVISDVAPYDVVAGSPARAVGRRFDSDTKIAEHERLLYGDD